MSGGCVVGENRVRMKDKRKVNEWQTTTQNITWAKQRKEKSISNFAGKHPHKRHWTLKKGDLFCSFAPHWRVKTILPCAVLLLPEMKTVWWIHFYFAWCLSGCSATASAVSWLKSAGDKWQSEKISWQWLNQPDCVHWKRHAPTVSAATLKTVQYISINEHSLIWQTHLEVRDKARLVMWWMYIKQHLAGEYTAEDKQGAVDLWGLLNPN